MECHQEAASPTTKLPSATDINPSRGSCRQTTYQGILGLAENQLPSHFQSCDLGLVIKHYEASVSSSLKLSAYEHFLYLCRPRLVMSGSEPQKLESPVHTIIIMMMNTELLKEKIPDGLGHSSILALIVWVSKL